MRSLHINQNLCAFVTLCLCVKKTTAVFRLKHFVFGAVLFFASALAAAGAEMLNSYTNHAGNVVSGVVVALDARTATISNAAETVECPLSIFPESERRRIAADFGTPRAPAAVRRAIAGAEKAMARSRKRAEKGLCTKEESDAFCVQSAAALRAYLDKQVESGVLTPAERKALGHQPSTSR